MHVNGTNGAFGNQAKSQPAAPAKTDQRFLSRTQTVADSSAAPGEIAGASFSVSMAESSEQNGVLRLLQEGHFKGVADVRLRINFHDELTADAAAAGAQAAITGTNELIVNVTAGAQEMIEGWELGEEPQNAANQLLAGYKEAAEAALADSTHDGKVDATGLADRLQQVFETLSQGLADLAPSPPSDEVTPPSEDAPESELPTEAPAAADPVAGSAEADDVTPPAPNPELETLAQSFADQLAGLLTSINEVSSLTPLTSEPTGNGKAYDKFVSAYNELIGQIPTSPPLDGAGEEPVNMLA